MSNIKVFDLIIDNPDIVERPREMKVQWETIAPMPGGQTDFMSRMETEVLFGGAAGPGKTFCLVYDAMGLQFRDTEFGMAAIDHPHYRAILFRRTSTRLQNLIEEAKKLYLPLGARFVLNRKGEPGSCFTFPSGAKIFLAHLEQPDDVEAHQGAEYQYIGFDELTQFLLRQYLYLFSRLRGVVINNGVSIMKRMRSTTNPTGEGLVWVKKRFIKNTSISLIPGKTCFFIADPDVDLADDNPMGIEVQPGHPKFLDSISRTFIPGLLVENKVLMESDPSYASHIMQLGKKDEAALLHGDWDAFGGDFFDMFDKTASKIQPFDIPPDWPLIGAIDPGWSSPCVFILGTRDKRGRLIALFTYYVRNSDPETHAINIKNMIKNFSYTHGRMPDTIVAGHDAFAKKDKFSINRTELTFADIFNNHGIYLQRAVTDRVIGWWVVKKYFQKDVKTDEPNFFYFDGYNDSLIDEVIAMQTDENDVEDLKGKGNDPNVVDHACDTIRYEAMAFPMPYSKNDKYIPIRADGYKKRRERKDTAYTVMSM